MINAAIAGLGWWGKNIVNAVQGKSTRLRFIRGVSKFCEKPLAMKKTDALRAVQTCAQAGIVLGLGTNKRLK